jgi:hypothetical protein
VVVVVVVDVDVEVEMGVVGEVERESKRGWDGGG